VRGRVRQAERGAGRHRAGAEPTTYEFSIATFYYVEETTRFSTSPFRPESFRTSIHPRITAKISSKNFLKKLSIMYDILSSNPASVF
jgi:hypothetical protein